MPAPAGRRHCCGEATSNRQRRVSGRVFPACTGTLENCGGESRDRATIVTRDDGPGRTSISLGIFAGAAIGAAIFGRFGLNRWTLRDTFLSIIPDEWLVRTYEKNRRGITSLGIAAIFVIPMGVDGFTQLLTDYESNNVLRLVTGLGFGLILGWIFVASLCARPKDFNNSGQVILPGGARFQLIEEE